MLDEAISRSDTQAAVGAFRSQNWRSIFRRCVRVVLPTLIFGWYHSFGYLNPLAAPRLMFGSDWTTYVVSPNFLRSSSFFTWPAGEIPNYVAPIGTNLAQTDSFPVLLPLYRVLLAVFPNRPIQIVGLALLVAVILTFNAVAGFLDMVQSDGHWLWRELATLAVASVAVIAPFWNLQYNHPALMQAWIIVWALTGALRRCPSLFSGGLEKSPKKWTGLGPICAAAAVQPYLIPMVLLPALAPDLVAVRSKPRWVALKCGVACGLILLISVSLGYLSGGGQLGSPGFGNYAADLASVIDPNGQSRFVTDLPSTPDSIGGYGYLGLGGLFLLAGAGYCFLLERRRPPVNGGRNLHDRRPLHAVYVSVAMLTAYSIMPRVRILGHEVLHFEKITDQITSLTSIFRVNGRYIWVFIWLILLLAGAQLIRSIDRRLSTAILAVALGLQVADVVPFPPLLRASGQVEYLSAAQRLRDEQQSGATSIEFQPPVVIPGCYSVDYESFEVLGDVLLAAAVVGLPVNSGYTARLNPAFIERNCVDDALRFADQKFRPDVLYVLPATYPEPVDLVCSMITVQLRGCRTEQQ